MLTRQHTAKHQPSQLRRIGVAVMCATVNRSLASLRYHDDNMCVDCVNTIVSAEYKIDEEKDRKSEHHRFEYREIETSNDEEEKEEFEK